MINRPSKSDATFRFGLMRQNIIRAPSVVCKSNPMLNRAIIRFKVPHGTPEYSYKTQYVGRGPTTNPRLYKILLEYNITTQPGVERPPSAARHDELN